MGKDQDLLDAARNGNITLIEKILYQRGKRSGPLASLRRGPGANIQDSTGYSALHHASLNGHTECVRLLLVHDASTNLPDYRGSSALHLAAWAGHQDIVKLLLTQSHRPANPNLQTMDNETPLHCAAQHGHTGALTTLLAHGANPNMVNNRGEKPLDLAAQYGRLQVVQMLIRAHPELLLPYKKNFDGKNGGTSDGKSNSGNCKTNSNALSHSPLHLASRNGHKNVVEVLLAAGVDVNLLAASGTALHEAALCGKDLVVKALLEFGADLSVTDSEGRTALDLLKEFPPHVTKGIVSVISNHQNAIAISNSEQEDILKVSRNIPSSREGYYHSQDMRECHAWSSYSNDASSMIESPSSSMGSLDPSSPRLRASMTDSSAGNFYVTMVPLNSSNSKVSPTPPKKPPRRNLSISPTTSKPLVSSLSMRSGTGSSTSPYEYLYMAHSGDKKSIINKAASMDQCQNYVKMMNPNLKNQQRLQHTEQVLTLLDKNTIPGDSVDDEHSPILTTQLRSYNPNRKLRRIRDNYEFCINGSRDTYGSGNNHNDSGDDNIPMSPSNYRQPPTPEHPPPNAMHAEKVILERIRPLSQEYRRSTCLETMGKSSNQNGTATFGGFRSRNSSGGRGDHQKKHFSTAQQSQIHPHSNQFHHQPQQQHQRHLLQQQQQHPSLSHRNSHYRDDSVSPCSSDLLMSHSLNASSGSLSSSVSLSDRSASTDCVEEFIADVPFAGLFKGSTMTLDNPNLITYGMNNSQLDYKHYQSMAATAAAVAAEQQQHPHQSQGKSFQSPAFDKKPQMLSTASAQYLRPERPKTLETQTSLSNSPKPLSVSFLAAAQTTNTHTQQKTLSDDLAKTKSKSVKSSGNYSVIDSGNTLELTTAHSSALSTFDEQEEWAKISEIMANFGTDLIKESDIIPHRTETSLFTSSGRRKGNQNRLENGRSNSVGGFIFTDVDGPRNTGNTQRAALTSGESLGGNSHRESGSQSPHSQLTNWLYSNELEDLSSVLYDNGYDDVEFIKGILDESDLDLLDIGVENRKKLMEAIETDLKKPPQATMLLTTTTPNTKSSAYHSKSTNNDKTSQINSNNNDYTSNSNNNNYSTIPKQKNQSNCDPSNLSLSIEQWLSSIRLSQYAEVFKKHLYTDMERISRIWEIELQAVLEINKLGHRKRILYSVGATPPKDEKFVERITTTPNSQELSSTNKANVSRRTSLANPSLEIDNVSVESAPEHRPNHRKNRQAPKPPTMQQQSVDKNIVNKLVDSTSNLEIRAPSELLLGFPTGLRTQWRHSAQVLISGAVKYEVNYLGSTVVKELRGTESTRKSIQKLKKGERILGVNSGSATGFQNNPHHSSKRAVFILISHRGVQFVDPQSQGTICEHEIRNINCACQDADDLSHFAYITKDSDYNTHYCHVFNVVSMDLATEIILTLGQAFEVAYQIALRKSTPTTPIRSPVNNQNVCSTSSSGHYASGSGGGSSVVDQQKLLQP